MLPFVNPTNAKTDAEVLKELGGMLKQRRINNNFTQQEFADSVGISKDQLSKIERTGKTSLATLAAISRKFNLLKQLLAVYETPDLTPMQKYELEQKSAKMKRQRVKK
jgi:transcriptional regulator with XRE-family HTH domain